ncbi:MAG: DUF4364 family protein [Eubacteriales bacterium]|jgi:hypothetical protein|nr:DUF4364 family protein [Eubacteriales bacterium]MDD4134107.1 DUF4364 family protein [Eubacteriales bacterium]NLO14364.1 DUF4364 family protein [Clostridiales bacterium]
MTRLPQRHLGEVERKLLTLYALRALGPCTNLQLITFMGETEVMNYFDLQTALYELLSGGLIDRAPMKGDERYTLTRAGEGAIALFAQRAVTRDTDTIDEKAPAYRARWQREREVFAGISHEGQHEYHVSMGISDGEMPLMRLDLSLPTAALAERFRAAWQEEAQGIYDHVLRRLSGEEGV